MTSDNVPDRVGQTPVIRRRDGTPRTDIVVTPDDTFDVESRERDPIRVVGRRIPRPREIPDAAAAPGRATGIATTMTVVVHLLRRVLPRYLIASAILVLAAWAFTGTAWVVYTAAGLPLVVWVWWVWVVMAQARRYRRGEASPPPGWFGW